MRPRLTDMERFWPKVNQDGPVPVHRPDLGACWLWLAQVNADGYPQFHVFGRRGAVGAYRWLYEQTVAPIRDGLEPDHLCRVRQCVRPSHIEPVTHAENIRRVKLAWTHCRNGHPLPAERVGRDTDAWRVCETCRALSASRNVARAHARYAAGAAVRARTALDQRRAHPRIEWRTSAFERAATLGWSDGQLAQALGVSWALVSYVRSGKRRISAKWISGLRLAFPDVPDGELLWAETVVENGCAKPTADYGPPQRALPAHRRGGRRPGRVESAA